MNRLDDAGVAIVVASGNIPKGSSKCTKINRAPAQYLDVFAITGIDGNEERVETSAAGPAIINAVIQSSTKPDYSHYGRSVVSSVFAGGESKYFPASGGVVGAAVFAGSLGLLWSANPSLKNDLTTTRCILENVVTYIASTDCGSPEGESFNYIFGRGTVNFYDAYEFSLNKKKMKDLCGVKIEKKQKKKGDKKKNGKKRRRMTRTRTSASRHKG